MKNDTRGVAILITLTILGAILAVGMGIALIVARELRITGLIEDSTAAIMASDTGLERALYEVRVNGADPDANYPPVTLSNGATYEICPSGAQCRDNNPVRIITEGSSGETTRSLQVEF